MDLGLLLGSPEGHFGGHFGARFANRSDYVDFLVIFPGLGKMSENGAPQGGGHAIRPRRRMFREGRPSSLRLRFGLHFGVILGAKCATILLFGRPGDQNRLTKERVNKNRKTGDILGAGRGGREGVTLRWECSPRLAFSDIWDRNRGYR